MSQSIRTIAVLGSGTMGRGIAHVSAQAGYDTCLYDVSGKALTSARASIERNLDKGVSLGKVEPADAESALARLRTSEDLGAAVSAADLVIEAIPEDPKLKIETFREVSKHCGEHTLFGTNTSALSVTEIATGVTGEDGPSRCAGMHFFNPVHLMKLVELVRGLETSDETLEAMRQVAVRMGKTVVTVNEAPGFVTSRINALIGNEAFRMLQEGVASARDIDVALKLGLNHPMGPFEMVDLVGLDVRLSILKYLHSTLGESYRPNRLLVQYVQAGRYGRKVGKGVYLYDEHGRRIEEG